MSFRETFGFIVSYLEKSSIDFLSSLAPWSRSHLLEREVCRDGHDEVVTLSM